MKPIYLALDKLEKQVDTPAFQKQAEKRGEWGGADVIICRKPNEDQLRWSQEQFLALPLPMVPPRHRLVVTPYSLELSYLFENLRDIFVDLLDFSNKYDFYGGLAQAALDYQQAGEGHSFPELAKAVIGWARKYLGGIQ
ncbi:MAG: hypothetical protein FJ135_09420 [Deltaproteobacteria bacterium]|nr:hypothetical protein [Deltaproteobacteria bacterium]